MKIVDVHKGYMITHITEQLNKLGYHDTEGKSLNELKRKLAALRAMGGFNIK